MKFESVHNGFSVMFHAESWEQAEAHCDANGLSKEDLGVVIAEIPVSDVFKNISAVAKEIKVKHYGQVRV